MPSMGYWYANEQKCKQGHHQRFVYNRDANLWRPKIGRLSFFHYPPPEFQQPPSPPPRKIDPAPNGNDLGHYMTSYMMYILSKFEIIVLMLEIIFVND